MTSTEYLARVNPDHSPLALDLLCKSQPKEFCPWKLYPTLLSNFHFCTSITQSIDLFLETNRTDDIRPSLLWETLRAVLRGKIISYLVHIGKTRKEQKQELLKSIADLDKCYEMAPTAELYKEKVEKQTEFNILSTKEDFQK